MGESDRLSWALVVEGCIRLARPERARRVRRASGATWFAVEKLRTSSRVRASTGAPSDDPFVVAKSGHLTAALVGLPNAGKSYVFHRLGGDRGDHAGYPF